LNGGAAKGRMKGRIMKYQCAILDDYQNVALKMADWSTLADNVDVKVFNDTIPSAQVAEMLKPFAIVCMMRERTPVPRAVIEALPELKLLITSGLRNASIDVAAATERGVTVCGTESVGEPTAELAIGLMLELTRHIGFENARMKAGAPWQVTLGGELAGKTLGLLGLGKLGSKVAEIGRAIGMKTIAWSQNLTEDKARAGGASLVSKEELFRQADFISIHIVLSPRSRGLVGATELGLMKPSAFLINTSRGPIIEESALVEALKTKRIAGAGLDVFDVEPLPVDHPLRKLDNTVLTPHLGYVTADNYRRYYPQMVEDIQAWLAGKPVRVIQPR
jgi:phosphoglycerate dehydrogenase-like enzyme